MKNIRFGIGTKLIAGFFLLAFLPLLGMGIFVFQGSKDDIISTKQENLTSLVRLLKHRIENFTNQALETTSMLSRVPRLQQLSLELYNGNIKDDIRREMRSTLMSFIHPDGDIEAFFLLHPETGEVLSSSNIYDEGKFFDKRPYYILGRKSPMVSRVHYSPSREKSILAVATPIYNEGKLLGVLVGWVNLDNLSFALSPSKSANAYMVNRANLYILDANPIDGGLNIQSGVFTDGAERALAGITGTGVYVGPTGEDVVGAYTLIETLDLALMIEEPLSAVMKNVNAMGMKVLGLVLILAAAVLVVAMLMGHRVASPFVTISRRAQELVSKGAFTRPIEVTRTDELGTLSESMNRLSDNLALKESELQQLLSTMDTLVEHIPEGVVLLDATDQVVLANPMAQIYLMNIESIEVGDTLKSIRGRSLEEFNVSPSNLVWHEVQIDEPSPAVFEIAARSIEGINGAQGKVLVMKDITQVREVENRVQAQERLAAVGCLAAGISHDFNNILTSVIGYSEMLLDDDSLTETARMSVEAIQKSGTRAADLIGQILDFSRRSVSEFSSLNLRSIFKEFMLFIKRTLSENIRIIFDFEEGDYVVRADPTKMLQVLANLAVNARDAMSEGGKLEFHVSHIDITNDGENPPIPEMHNGKWVLIQVSDTGEGISPDVLPHIFEPFYTTKPKDRGTGLGLAQVYGLVKQHGGFINVESILGEGTKFLIFLPALGVLNESTDKEDVSELEEELALQAKGQTVLIVEDDPIVRELLVQELSHSGYRVQAARDGAEALQFFTENVSDVDLVITDVAMPGGMDGIELSRRIQEVRAGTKVVAITGYSVTEEERYPEGAGIIEWVQKPFRMQYLNTVMSRVLAHEPGSSPQAENQPFLK